jgi:hypothetical protein
LPPPGQSPGGGKIKNLSGGWLRLGARETTEKNFVTLFRKNYQFSALLKNENKNVLLFFYSHSVKDEKNKNFKGF